MWIYNNLSGSTKGNLKWDVSLPSEGLWYTGGSPYTSL